MRPARRDAEQRGQRGGHGPHPQESTARHRAPRGITRTCARSEQLALEHHELVPGRRRTRARRGRRAQPRRRRPRARRGRRSTESGGTAPRVRRVRGARSPRERALRWARTAAFLSWRRSARALVEHAYHAGPRRRHAGMGLRMPTTCRRGGGVRFSWRRAPAAGCLGPFPSGSVLGNRAALRFETERRTGNRARARVRFCSASGSRARRGLSRRAPEPPGAARRPSGGCRCWSSPRTCGARTSA